MDRTRISRPNRSPTMESVELIKQFVDAGRKVAYQSDSYRVIKGLDNDYYIKSEETGHSIKLVQPKTGKINGEIKDFYLIPDMSLEEFRSRRREPHHGNGPIYYPDDYQIIQVKEGEYLVECSNWHKTFGSLQEAEECLWEEWKDS